MSVDFVSGLNLAWAAVAVLSLGVFVWPELRAVTRTRRPRGLAALVVGAFLLFPYISVNDDLLWFQALLLQSNAGEPSSCPQPKKSEEKRVVRLASLLEALNHCSLSHHHTLLFTPRYFNLAEEVSIRLRGTALPLSRGRAPPFLPRPSLVVTPA